MLNLSKIVWSNILWGRTWFMKEMGFMMTIKTPMAKHWSMQSIPGLIQRNDTKLGANNANCTKENIKSFYHSIKIHMIMTY